MKIENRIQQYQHLFTKVDHQIANFILTLDYRIDIGAINDLAHAIGVSPSSVTRFAYKLNYDSFQSFRFAIQHELQNEPIHQSPSIQILHQHYRAIMDHTGEFLSENDLMYLVNAIKESEKIIFLGIGSSGLSAQEIYFRTARMGFHAIAITDPHLMTVVGHMCTPHTTIVAFTNSGATQEIIDSLRHGSQNGAKRIGISHFRTPALETYCDRIIMTADRSRTHDAYFINSQLSNQFIIDLVSYHLLQDVHRFEHYMKSYHELATRRQQTPQPPSDTI
ncbi:MurR/RpiR family transcriptional regulator [Staphylococcus lutrae]|uniref:Sialic acid utilization regulator, RpiR family protein n=1 Tax=Staphylococcus lutrae TaxID=155085 RepID=A0AAC9WJC8_9STAP|nr:MurR/RpiR family transcriptional regulator [Staphylococcus lutrae]ARJ51120.1 sialic acid utilization regulator, RpiR family protein [Staphylococcus lutrae]PNZ34821.1 MurR/RpiR family transcriptional regulator [Staphylococcus lutrae]